MDAHNPEPEESPSYKLCKVKIGNKYGLVKATEKGGNMIIPVVADEITPMEEFFNDEYLFGLGFIIRVGNQYGFADDNAIILYPEFDRIIYTPRKITPYLTTEKDGKYGMHLEEYTIPAEYDEIRLPEVMGWVKVRKGNTWGFIDAYGAFTEDIQQAYIMDYNIGDIYYPDPNLADMLKFLFDDYGSFVRMVLPEDENISLIYDHTVYFEQRAVFHKYNTSTLKKSVGLKHLLTNTILIPNRYDSIELISGNIFLYQIGNKYGFVLADGKGTELCPPIYDEVETKECNSQIIPVRIGQKWGFANFKNNIFPTHLEYDELLIKEGNYLPSKYLVKKDGKIGLYLVNKSIPPIYDGIFIPEVYGWIRVLQDGVWGYLDINLAFTADESRAFLLENFYFIS